MAEELTDAFPGAPYEVIEFLHPRRWHGFASRTVSRIAFRWGAGPDTPKEILGEEIISQERWVWRGFSPAATCEVERRLETGLLPGAQARRVDVDE